MRILINRLSFLALFGACLVGCFRSENPTDTALLSGSVPLGKSVSDATSGGERSEVESEPAVDPLQEETSQEMEAVEEPEIEPIEVNEVATSPPDTTAPEPPLEGDVEESLLEDDPIEPDAEAADSRPLLTREVIDAFAQLGQKREDADELLVQHLSNLASAYNLRDTEENIDDYMTVQIYKLHKSEAGHTTRTKFPVPIDMKVGRPSGDHHLPLSKALPSMRLGLLKYLIDRSKDGDDFRVDAWLDITSTIERKLVNVVEPVFETRRFLQLLKEITEATDLWAYTNFRIHDTRGSLRDGFSVGPLGGITFHQLGGVQGIAKRRSTQLSLRHNLERLDFWRTKYELAKLDIDLLMGESLRAALSESELEQLEHMWGAGVLLSPRQFYRIRWLSQYGTDLAIREAVEVIREKKGDVSPYAYIARAELFAKKGTQPYMVYADLRKAFEVDPEIRFGRDLMQKLDAAVEVLDIENRVYNPNNMKELYFDSLRIFDE